MSGVGFGWERTGQGEGEGNREKAIIEQQANTVRQVQDSNIGLSEK